MYSSMTQKYSYTRAIEDYTKNIERLSEDFDDALKEVQAGILQQFQEIDNKIGLTTAQLAQAYWTLETNTIWATSKIKTDFLLWLSDNEDYLKKIHQNSKFTKTFYIKNRRWIIKIPGRKFRYAKKKNKTIFNSWLNLC